MPPEPPTIARTYKSFKAPGTRSRLTPLLSIIFSAGTATPGDSAWFSEHLIQDYRAFSLSSFELKQKRS